MTKAFLICLISILWIFTADGIGQTGVQYVSIQEPGGSPKEKNRLLIDHNQVEIMIGEFVVEGVNAHIEFADQTDLVQARLGTIADGRIKWAHKVVDDRFLLVKFHKTYYEEIMRKMETQSLRPGYQILLSDTNTQTVIKGYEITFAKLPDLQVDMSYPVKASIGVPLRENFSVTVTNNGAAEAKNIRVVLLLSADENIPVVLPEVTEAFQEDMLLPNGEFIIESLPATRQVRLDYSTPPVFAQDTPPGNYYLAARVDPDNRIRELNKENNVFKGFIILTLPEPERIILELPDCELLFNPTTYGLQIVSHGLLLSDGKDWRKCRMKAYMFQIMHVGWQDFHWEINTLDRAVWQVTGAEFCKTGGKGQELDIDVAVKGGSKIALPQQVRLRLPTTRIEYRPATKKLTALTAGNQIIYVPFWKVCRVSPLVYQFSHAVWEDYFLEINAQEKQAYRVTGGNFCRAGGTQESLDFPVSIE